MNMRNDVTTYTGKSYEKHRIFWSDALESKSRQYSLIKSSLGKNSPQDSYKDITVSPKMATWEDHNLFISILAAVNIVSNRYYGDSEIIVHAPPISNVEPKDTSAIPILLNYDHSCTNREHLNNTKDAIRDSYQYHDYPLSLISDTNPEVSFKSNVLVIFDQIHTSNIDSTDYGLVLEVSKIDGTLKLSAKFNESVEIDSVEPLLGHINSAMVALNDFDNLVAEIEVFTETDKEKVLLEFNNDSRTDIPASTMVELFEAQVKRSPNAIAVSYKDVQLTYSKVNGLANHLSEKIRAHSAILPNDIIGLMVQRSELMVIGLMGILKSGAAYLPIDCDAPEKRKEFMLEDAKVKLLITELDFMLEVSDFDIQVLALDIELQGHQEASNPMRINTPENTAYVIYTSGSTGLPKGVCIAHESITNYLNWFGQTFGISPKDKTMLVSSIAFDLSYTAFWTSLMHGAQVNILPDKGFFDLQELVDTLLREDVTYLKLTPSHLSLILDNTLGSQKNQIWRTIRLLALGGESVDQSKVRELHAVNNQIQIINHYGPTETTVGVIANPLSDIKELDGRQIIGRPITNMEVFILNKQRQPVPIGVEGEIYVAGPGVAIGYLNRPELTLDKFFDLNFLGREVRCFATGDKGRWLVDGKIEFNGRQDDQLKLNGYRIELGEIQTILNKHSEVDESTILVVQMEFGPVLVGYYTSTSSIEQEALKSYMKMFLPAYMIPNDIILLDRMPFNANGKLDRKVLLEMAAKMGTSANYIAPSTDLEKLLVETWEKVLGRTGISIDANFFELGGDSIRAVQVASKMHETGYEIEVKDIFDHPTIDGFEHIVKPRRKEGNQSPDFGSMPLTPVQRWFYAKDLQTPDHYNQAVGLKFTKKIERNLVEEIFSKLITQHDALRSTFKSEGERSTCYIESERGVVHIDEAELEPSSEAESLFEEKANKIQRSLDITDGDVVHLGLYHHNEGSWLLIVAHHLVIDGISWRILLEDIILLLEQAQDQKELSLPPRTASYKLWAEGLTEYAQHEGLLQQCNYWQEVNDSICSIIDPSGSREQRTLADLEEISFELSNEQTNLLLSSVNQTYNTEINDILLTALVLSVSEIFSIKDVPILLEGHGREKVNSHTNITRTIGWFTTHYPIVIEQSLSQNLTETIVGVKEQLRKVPQKGLGYGVIKHLMNDGQNRCNLNNTPQIKFNYLGQFESNFLNNQFYEVMDISVGDTVNPEEASPIDFDITGIVLNQQLKMTLRSIPEHNNRERMNSWWESYHRNLVEIIDFCSSQESTLATPSDFTYSSLSMEDIDSLFD